jgi:hypothetical protein
MNSRKRLLPVDVDDETTLWIEATMVGGETEVAYSEKAFSREAFAALTSAMEAVSREIKESISKVKPQKVKIEFGIEAAVKSGELVSILVSADSTSTFKITLEWEPGADR